MNKRLLQTLTVIQSDYEDSRQFQITVTSNFLFLLSVERVLGVKIPISKEKFIRRLAKELAKEIETHLLRQKND